MLRYLISIIFLEKVSCDIFSSINLPDGHFPYYFSTYPEVAKKCEEDPDCPYKNYLHRDKCWGYEYNSDWDKQYSVPWCPGDHRGWVKTKFDQKNTFYTQADFGYVKQQLKEMKVLCEPLFPHDSSLECSEHLRFCRGRNIMINFTSLLGRDEPLRYKMDVLKAGEIGGYCDFYKDRLDAETDHISALQSWGPELRYFTKLNKRPIEEGDCDVVIDKPTFIMKIDAIWETFTYYSAFEPMWEAFTNYPLWDLKTFRGKTVCFRNVVFPLLPRMIFGLYYNTPIIYGCEKSGLFKAFSEFVLHRLRIPVHKRTGRKVRVTLLARDTKYRRILNEDELVAALQKNKEYIVQRVVFNRNMNFKKQLEITLNSDVFIGMHGAGLTHLLFLPDWAAIFELYNCEDENCYKDLARLRGVKYITWENGVKVIQQDEGSHPEGGAHAKFTNYSFDVKEFLRLVKKAADHVKSHPLFKELINSLQESQDIHDEL